MRPLRTLLIYFAVVFLGGALLAPWLYWLLQWTAAHHTFTHLAAQPFHRFLDRSLLGLALICLWPLLRGSGMNSWAEIGFAPNGRSPVGDAAKGALLGWMSLAAVAVVTLAFRVNSIVTIRSPGELIQHLFNAAWSAVIVAILEELVFRGALFGILRKSLPCAIAVLASSAVYSVVHFIKNGDLSGAVAWNSGLKLLAALVMRHPPMVPAFFTLLAAGSILAILYQRTGALYFSIGLHAGWIFWLKSYRFLLNSTAEPGSFWGSGNLIDGWLACLILCVILASLVIAPRKQS